MLRHQLQFYVTDLYFFVEEGYVVIVKGQEATEEGVEEDAHAPQVCLTAQVLLARNQLWGRVRGTAAARLQLLLHAALGTANTTMMTIIHFELYKEETHTAKAEIYFTVS